MHISNFRAGGDAGGAESVNGEGGYSYTSSDILHVFYETEANSGPGEAYVVPAISDCGCDFRCVVKDRYLSEIMCICQPGRQLTDDGRTCIGKQCQFTWNFLSPFFQMIFRDNFDFFSQKEPEQGNSILKWQSVKKFHSEIVFWQNTQFFYKRKQKLIQKLEAFWKFLGETFFIQWKIKDDFSWNLRKFNFFQQKKVI